jgi:hypothetical protein
MRRNQWFGLAAGVVLAWLAATISAWAQAPAAPPENGLAELRREVSQLGIELLRARAESDELKEEEKLLAPTPRPGGAADTRRLAAREELWDQALGKATAVAGTEEVLGRLGEVLKSAKEDEKVALDAWSSAQERSLDLQDAIAEAKAEVGRSWDAGPPGGGLPPNLIVLGMLAVLGGLVLTLHEARDRIRWRLRALGSRPSLIAMAVALPLAAACAAPAGAADEDRGPEAAAGATGGPEGPAARLRRSRAELKEQLAAQQRANDTLRKKLDDQLEEARQARAAFTLTGQEPGQKERVSRAEGLEAEVQTKFRAVRVAARAAARAAGEAQRIEGELNRDTARLAGFVKESRDAVHRNGLLRLGACGLFVLAALVPLIRVRSHRRKLLSDESRKCPRCLKKDTLTVADPAPGPADDRRPRDRLVVCEACDYEIRENYIREHRLCFPTVGIYESGKTHWLAMLYRQVKNTNVQVESKIKKIPSLEDAAFNAMLEQILYRRRGTEATTYSRLPYPLTFHVNDADPLGTSRTMVNMFDFSGELTRFRIDGEAQQNEFRRRALLCEGFTLFLDPTQVTREAKASIEAQVDALAEFIAEMHAMRGIPMEQPIDLPIAVCVSKIDLLVNENPIGTRAIPLVADLRETMGQAPTLALIHQRSQLIAAALPEMFPNWSVERELRENFGGRYMFFPISSVGLDEQELGVKDFSERSIAPYGVLEPLLWLLHMHGYCVLN